MNSPGSFIISLDFELNWGVHDVFALDQYKENLLGVREAIPNILSLFEQYEIHATWAVVGLLSFDNKQQLLSHLPEKTPSYKDERFCPYKKIDTIGDNEVEDPLHFGASLIRKILKVPHQELATHTFSHYYCLEDGQTIEEFEEDLMASLNVNHSFGKRVDSLIFPRNQTNHDYLTICKMKGIKAYRGNEESWVYKADRFYNESYAKRLLRLADQYVNLFGHHTYELQSVSTDPIVNLPSSRFLRPYSQKLKAFEPLRLSRIKKSLVNAAKKGEVFHLWWHPHNFGRDMEENLAILIEILILVDDLRTEYGFQSMTMEEAATSVLQMKEAVV